MRADPAAHLDAALLLFRLLILPSDVPAAGALGKRRVQDLGAEEGAGPVELAEVAEGDDSIHSESAARPSRPPADKGENRQH